MDRRQFFRHAAAISGWAIVSGGRPSWAASETSHISWHRNLRDAHTLSVEHHRPMLIVFSAAWCTYCHKLLREAGADRKLSAFVSTNFIPTQLDFDKDSRIAKVLEVEALPTIVVLSPRADLLLRHAGYMKPEALRKLLNEALIKQAEIQQVNAADSVSR